MSGVYISCVPSAIYHTCRSYHACQYYIYANQHYIPCTFRHISELRTLYIQYLVHSTQQLFLFTYHYSCFYILVAKISYVCYYTFHAL